MKKGKAMKLLYALALVFITTHLARAEWDGGYKRYSVAEYAHKIADQFSALSKNT